STIFPQSLYKSKHFEQICVPFIIMRIPPSDFFYKRRQNMVRKKSNFKLNH
ncbi:uncharacterized protein METZ01_LOCUS179516, partial [marine metagenome]